MNYPSDNKEKPPKPMYFNGYPVVICNYLKYATKGINRPKRTLNKWTKRYKTTYKRYGGKNGQVLNYEGKLLMHEKTWERIKELL